MKEQGAPGEFAGCPRPDIGETIAGYCFGDLREAQLDAFEAHLLECEICWREVQRLDSLVRGLRSDKSLTHRQYASEIVGMAGISSNVHRFLGGHWLHALVAAGIYASMIAISVPMEVAYEYDRYSALVWTVSPLVLVWLIAATIGALAADWIVTPTGRTFGLAAAMGVFVVTAALQFIMVRPYLPAYSVTQASFQTWTAQAAYLKGVGYSAAFAAFFVLVPFHFVITMQRELHKGRHLIAFEFLTGGKFGIAPLGALYLRVWLLGVLLLAGAVYSIGSTSHLLEALKATQYSNLFILTIQIRWLLFLALGMEGVMWYHSALNELKRECTVVYRLANPIRAGRTEGSRDVV